MQKILIIGYGFSGSRFGRVLEYLTQKYPFDVKVAGVVDVKNVQLSIPDHIKRYSSLKDALADQKFDVAVVSVNERDHFEVLSQLAQSNIKTILCEKPLTETLYQAESLADGLRPKNIRMNMVERFSPVFQDFFKWQQTKGNLFPTRIQLHWGKNRLLDQRPTMGVLSEVIHPLDLMYYAFNVSSFETLGGFVHQSNFTCETDRYAIDSLHCKLLGPRGCMISVHTSFSWMKRRREVSAVLSDGYSSYLVVFQFDVPLWDCDRLEIHEISSADGSMTKLLETSYQNADFPSSLHQIYKVQEFVAHGLGLHERGVMKNPNVDLEHAIRLQQWLEQLDQAYNSPVHDHMEVMFPQSLEKVCNE